MSYQFTISDIGLRLIKAYEGYWPEARELLSGGKVVGFGHRVADNGIESLTEDEAEDVLKDDLAPIEDLINSRVHASMTQSQFDALCSLVFSIGEEAFMSSNMLHALNRGQVIEASNGFDLWRKGNINGQVYVVDALVRRRTAEKALFLRPTQRIARAPRYELTAVRDHTAQDFQVPVYQEPQEDVFSDATVHNAPVENAFDQHAESQQESPVSEPEKTAPRQTLSASASPVLYADDIEDIAETAVDDTVTNLTDYSSAFEVQTPVTDAADIAGLDDTPAFETIKTQTVRLNEEAVKEVAPEPEEEPSPIAAAAAEVSQRLDALIDNKSEPDSANDTWPDSLITSSIKPEDKPRVSPDEKPMAKADVVIDELVQDDALREQIARESQYNMDRYDDYVEVDDGSKGRAIWTFGIMIFLGLMAAVAGLIVNMRGSAQLLGANGPFITLAAMLIGFLLFIVGVIYLMKTMFARD